MKEDAAAKELENLLREALNTGLESPRGGTPILQLKTVPLQVQPVPVKPAAPAPAQAVPEPPSSTPGLAERLAPDSIRPPAPKASRSRSRTSMIALVALGTFALAAAGGAAWLAREKHAIPVASAATTAAAPTDETTSEGAVGIAVAARPADAPPANADAPKTEEPKPTTASHDEAKPAATPAPPPTFQTAPEPATPATAKAEAAESKPEVKETRAEVKPKPAATPAPKAEAKSEKPAVAAAEKTEKTDKVEKKEAPAPSTPPAGSVDALLQQQLKGAI